MWMRKWIAVVIKLRFVVLLAIVVITGLLASQVGKLRVEIDPNRFLPQSHPYVVTSNRVEDIFGSRYVLVVGISPANGDIYNAKILGKVDRITRKLREDQGVIKNTILSFSAKKAKSISGTADGMEIRPLMDKVPTTSAEIERLKHAIELNPAYRDTIVSRDGRSVAVVADFKDDPKGFRAIMDRVNPIIDAEREPSVQIALGGLPVLLTQLEVHSERMGVLLPIAMLLIGIVLWLSFRSIQGLFLPLLTGILAVLWSLGIMSAFGVPLDVFNATTPILILAVAAGHAVQILKRYHEEYERLTRSSVEPKVANKQAVIESLGRVGPVMIVAGMVAALSFLSLTVFEISSVRTFGIFAACGILAALALELTLIPVLRSMMRPSVRAFSDKGPGRVQRLMGWLADVIIDKGVRVAIVAAIVAVVAVFGATRIRVDDAFRSQFAASIPAMQDDKLLNERFGGTNALYVLVESDTAGRMQDPEVLHAIDGMQALMHDDPIVGKSLSIGDFIKRMNRAMHADDPKFDVIPDNRDLVAQYLFLYANGGDPGDFDTYVDYEYKHANIWGLLKEHDTHKLTQLVHKLEGHARQHMPAGVRVSFGGSVAQGTAIHEIILRSKVLNIAQLAGVVFLLTAVVFRSVIAGFLVLAPLVATVLVNFGLMGWTGIPLDVANSITSAMAVGIGADYVIYFLFRLREEQGRASSSEAALRQTLTTAGSAIFFVAAAVAAGYSVLLFSPGFWTHIWMGILISCAMLVSAIAALTIVPLLVRRLRPAFVGGPSPVAASASTAALVLMILGGTLSAPDANAQSLSADDVMHKNFVVDKVAGSTSKVTMTLRNKQGQERLRESTTLTRLQGNGIENQRLVRFVTPADVKGTAILLVEHARADDDMWIYLPALKKVRRLVASNKKDSFVGSDFSYGDVIGYTVDRVTGEQEVAGEACYVVESVPMSSAVQGNTGYSKRQSWISKSRFVMLKMDAWDTEGQLLKQTEFTDFRAGDRPGTWVAMHARAKNVQTGHQTDIIFGDYRLDAHVPLDAFAVRALESGS